MATNSFGLDAAYFSDKLSLVLRDLGHFTPEELARTLARMARTACEGVLGEAEFTVLAAPPAAEQPADTAMPGVLELLRERRELDGDARYLFGDDRVWAEKADAFLVSTAAEQPDGHSDAWPKAGHRCLCPACCRHRKSAAQPDTVAVPRELLGEAESIIDSYAEALRASHAPGGDWDGEEAAHDEYELEAGVASKLRALLAGGAE